MFGERGAADDAESQLLTRRLVLEPLLPRHPPALFAGLTDRALYAFMDAKPPESVEVLRAQYHVWSARKSPDGKQHWLNWAARLRDSDRYAGWFQATVSPHREADIAYLVFASHQRIGLGVEGCTAVIKHIRERYRVSKVAASVDARNTPSVKLAERLGMKRVTSRAPSPELRYEMDVRHERA